MKKLMTKLTVKEGSSATKKDALTLLSEKTTEGELTLTLSLYRVTMRGCEFHAVVSSDGRESDAAFLTGDPEEAERIFGMLVSGSVPPSTLREIVYDLLS